MQLRWGPSKLHTAVCNNSSVIIMYILYRSCKGWDAELVVRNSFKYTKFKFFLTLHLVNQWSVKNQQLKWNWIWWYSYQMLTLVIWWLSLYVFCLFLLSLMHRKLRWRKWEIQEIFELNKFMFLPSICIEELIQTLVLTVCWV